MSLLWTQVSRDIDDEMSRSRPHRHREVSSARAYAGIANRYHDAVRDRLARGEVQSARERNRQGIRMNGEVPRTRRHHGDHVDMDRPRESRGDVAIRRTSLDPEGARG